MPAWSSPSAPQVIIPQSQLYPATNPPPVVSLTAPTNGAVFVAPATFSILADASDPDGTVTNVEFFTSTNGVDFILLAETNGTPYVTTISNLPAGDYTLRARATDNLGFTGVSAPVLVHVIPPEVQRKPRPTILAT